MDLIADKEWHHLEKEEILEILQSNQDAGLTSEAAQDRIHKYGRNVITPKKKTGPFKRFLLQFNQALIYILLAATVVTIFLEEYIDAGVIFAVVLINAIIGFVQETKAVKAIESLSKSMSSKNSVIRNGKKEEVDAEDITVGDVIELQAGDKVPADARILRNKDLRVDESVLTGESVPSDKELKLLPVETGIGDRTNMVFASTMVAYGQAKAVVVSIGDKTEVGKISGFISAATDLETPLTSKIRHFSYFLLYVIIGFSVLTVIVGLLYGENFTEIFMASIALAVAAIPEGLPAAVTIMLAIGVTKMAKKKAIIRKLSAVETLGSTTVICSDKTGTLTENQMTVQRIFCGNRFYDITGLGYKPEGEIQYDKNSIKASEIISLSECLKAGILCNDSSLRECEGQYSIKGDPTEGALLVAAIKGGYDIEKLNSSNKRLDSIPFQSEYKYMASLHEMEGENLVYMKGSVEVVLEKCNTMLTEDGLKELDKDETIRKGEEMAAQGLRVLAFCMKELGKQSEIHHEDVSANMVFVGLQGMLDPPRKEAIEAVAICKHAGVKVKMITGDHAVTASTIASELGIDGKKKDGRLIALTGGELAKMDEKEFDAAALDISVFARVSPEQKLRLVQSLQKHGEIVAMTGDGVNDGPALKQANIGIAMGITGTEVAKEASDMVLTNDNFSSIEGAIEEGRGVFDNLTKFIVWTLPTNLGQGMVILVSVLIGAALFIEPVQALWINMTSAIFLGLMLAFEPKEPGIMNRAPRRPSTPILTRHLIKRTILAGCLIVMTAVAMFYFTQESGASIQQSRTVVATVIIVLQSFYLLNCRSLLKPLGQIGYFTNIWIYIGIAMMMLFQVGFIYLPFMNLFFHTEPIALEYWMYMIIAGIILFAIIEIEKKVIRKIKRKRS